MMTSWYHMTSHDYDVITNINEQKQYNRMHGWMSVVINLINPQKNKTSRSVKVTHALSI